MNERLDTEQFGPSPARRAFQDQVKQRMKVLKMSAADVARESGLSKDAISSYTKARSLPTEENLLKLAKALKCKPEVLRSVEDAKDPSTVVEVRESTVPGHKIVIARVQVPFDQVAALFDQLISYAKEDVEKKKK